MVDNESNIVSINKVGRVSMTVVIPLPIAASNGFVVGGRAMWVANPSGKGLILVPVND